MPQQLCPRCNQRYTVDNNIGGDYIHECATGNVTLDQEDVLITGETSDEYGTTVNTDVKGPSALLQGVQNKFQGTTAGVEGERFQGVTRRGANQATHRQRQHFEYIKLSEEK